MAGGDKESKTEKPTPRRRSEARRKGQVAKSQDLNVCFLMMAIFAALFFLGETTLGKVSSLMKGLLQRVSEFDFDRSILAANIGWVLQQVIWIVLPLVGIVFVIMLLINLVQIGFLLTGEPLKPDLTKLDPIKSLARIFSLRGVTKVSFGILKVAVIGGVLVWTLLQELLPSQGESVLSLINGESQDSLRFGLRVVLLMGMRGVIALLILAIFDYAYQRWQHERDLMMTKQEVKEEVAQMEGDPKIKQHRRRVQEQLHRQRMMQDVPNADVVVSNPTHFAVAIQYKTAVMSAPRCLAKGRDYVAQRIREVAMENGVPVVERPQLARALYAAVQVGQEIPQEFYQAVAEVLAYVYKLAGKPSAVR